MKKVLFCIIYCSIASIIAACAPNVSPNTYTGSEVGVVSKVNKGVILSKRPVSVDNSTGAGGLTGAAAGATGGAMLGTSTGGSILGGIGGAVVGGVVGNAIDKSVNHHQGYEYIIKLDNDQTVSVVQTSDMAFSVNQHVLVIYGAMTRIVPDNTPSSSNKKSKAS